MRSPTRDQSASSPEVAAACLAARDCFELGRLSEPTVRAGLLRAIGAGLKSLGDDLVNTVAEETHLALPRVATERDRTVFQLETFAAMAEASDWVEAVIHHGDPTRQPLARPDLRRMLRPLGPVAVFGASNFPLAYGAVGGDTGSALAAGCPVVVKGHPAHPLTGEMIAAMVARVASSRPEWRSAFAYLRAIGEREQAVGEELVSNQAICAVGFTGSFNGGMALARLGAARPIPIPVFAEMGSANPVFILPQAAASRGPEIADALARSIKNSCGQMCTSPGLIFGITGASLEAIARQLAGALAGTPGAAMLTERIAGNFVAGVTRALDVSGVRADGTPRAGQAMLLRTTAPIFLGAHVLAEEIFGPAAILVECADLEELLACARGVNGSLTGTLWATDADGDRARVFELLERKAGRVIMNGVPTGVEVSPAMVHGGPHPATNQPHTSAVGSLAVRRWCRPVAYQNVADELLPPELRQRNPRSVPRAVFGDRKELLVIDSHTEGEPTRIIMKGAPDLGAGSVREQLEVLRSKHDWIRSAAVNEPRGCDHLVGAIRCHPQNPKAACGVIFFNNVGYLNMCVHGTLGLGATLLHTGEIGPGSHLVETPVGDVRIEIGEDHSLSVANVHSWRHAPRVPVEVPGLGTIHGDVAWGGNWFFLCDDHGLRLEMSNLEALTDAAWAIREALGRSGITGDKGGEIDHVELFAPPSRSDCDSKNFVLCPGRAYDRSPCGTGTSAKLACLLADGKLSPGQAWRQESIIGSAFTGRLTPIDGRLLPVISGAAYVTAQATLHLDPRDPFVHGIRP